MTRGVLHLLAPVLCICPGALACATTTTLPDTTPVYEDPIAPSAEPIAVERMSVNSPEPAVVDTTGLAPQEKPTEPEGPDSKAQASKAPEAGAPSAPSPTEAPEGAPTPGGTAPTPPPGDVKPSAPAAAPAPAK